MSEPSVSRSLIARIFTSQEEVRLRSGWRLLFHTILFLALLFVVAGVLIILSPLVGQSFFDSPFLNSLATFIAVLLSTWFARRFFDHRDLSSLGLRRNPYAVKDLLFGILLTALLMGGLFVIFIALSWTTFDLWAWENQPLSTVAVGTLGSLAAFILVGFSEEILSRGYQLQNLIEGLNLPLALFLSSAVFAFMHLGNPHSSAISTLGLLAAGYFLAYGWLRTGQLWLSIGLHIGWNFFEGTVFGFAVSGTESFRLIHHTVAGPNLITGGPFGPEAGLIILPFMLIGAWLINRYTYQRQS